MTALAFEAHHDDVALFAAYTAQDIGADVITVLEGHVQKARGLQISQQQRHAENDCAMRELGLAWTQWPYRDDQPDWDAVLEAMRAIDDRLQPETVLAPAVEPGGHEHHNHVGELALAVFGPERVVRYMTYVRGQGRSVAIPVEPSPDQVIRKLRALACFRSQIAEPSTRVWFLAGIDEWVA